jgi:hypothetical protein
LKRQATDEELRRALADMREAVHARLELKKPTPPPDLGGQASLSDVIRTLWSRFFSSGD